MILKVTKQELTTDTERVAEGSINYLTFSLECDRQWDEAIKTVRFKHSDSEVVYDVPFVEKGKCYYVPFHVLRKGRVTVGVIGTIGNTCVITTDEAYFDVLSSLNEGKTPEVPGNVYAAFVSELGRYRERLDRSSEALNADIEECRGLKTLSETYAENARASEKRVEAILKDVSGMLDAVGMAVKGIRKIEERLTGVNSRLLQSEYERERDERARVITESRRAKREEERRDSETDRKAAESRRSVAEKARTIADVQRSERILAMEKRLEKLENTPVTVSPKITVETVGDGEILLKESTSRLMSVTVYGESKCCDGRLVGIGEGGSITIKIDSYPVILPISTPLYSAGGICDEMTFCNDGSITVLRRTAVVTFNGSESIIMEKRGRRVMFALQLDERAPDTEVGSCFATSFNSEDETVWISGEYAFFDLDSEKYKDVPTFARALSNANITLVYPCLKPYEEAEGSIDPIEGIPKAVEYDGRLLVKYEKDVFKALEIITQRLNSLEEKGENNERIKEIHIP